jgi:hypothetical protein
LFTFIIAQCFVSMLCAVGFSSASALPTSLALCFAGNAFCLQVFGGLTERVPKVFSSGCHADGVWRLPVLCRLVRAGNERDVV